jgi:hypothetical protein
VVLQDAGYFAAADQLTCVLCDSTNGSDASFSNGFSMSAAWQAATLSPAGVCSCTSASNQSVMTTVSDSGRVFQRCLQCPAGTTANSSTASCMPVFTGLPSTAGADLAYVLNSLKSRGAGISGLTALQVGSCKQLGPSGKHQNSKKMDSHAAEKVS